jgi:geranylgeranylglyceryl phosphate synthase family protein
MMSKFCILIDPNKGEATERVFQALIKVVREQESLIEKGCVEAWVGCTKEQGLGTRKYLRLLREQLPASVPVVIFPGNPFQVFAVGDYIIVPDLLNAHRRVIHFLVWVGKSYHRIRKRMAKIRGIHFPVERKVGYLVLSPDSSAGRKIGARRVDDQQVMEIIHERLSSGWVQNWWGLYIEAGSGAKRSVSERTELVREIRKGVGSRIMILTGGGIRSAAEAAALLEAGSDYIVVSSVLEDADDPKPIIDEFLAKIGHFAEES